MLGPTALERGENGVTISFQGVAIKDRAGRTLLAAPKGDISLDLLALATLDVKAKRLELVGLDLRLTVQPDGSVSVEGAKEPDAIAIDLPAPKPTKGAPAVSLKQGAPPAFAAQLGPLVWNLIEAVTGQDQALDRLGVAHGRLEVENGATHQKVVFEDLDLAFDKSAASAALTLSALGPAGRWSVAVKAQGEGLRSLDIEAHDLDLDDLLLATGARRPSRRRCRFPPSSIIQLAADKSLAAMRGRFGLGAGYFKLDDPDHEPFLVDEITGGWSWDAATPTLSRRKYPAFRRPDACVLWRFGHAAVGGQSGLGRGFEFERHGAGGRAAGRTAGPSRSRRVFHARYLTDEKPLRRR